MALHRCAVQFQFYPWTFFISFFFMNPPCSAAMQWTAIKISEVSFNNWHRDLAHGHPTLIFTGAGQKVRNLSSLSITQIWATSVWKCSIRILKQNAILRWSPYVLAKLGEVGFTHPWESSIGSYPPPKIAREKALNWLIDWVRLNVPPTHYRSYGDGFLRSNDPTNSVKALKEHTKLKQIEQNTTIHLN